MYMLISFPSAQVKQLFIPTPTGNVSGGAPGATSKRKIETYFHHFSFFAFMRIFLRCPDLSTPISVSSSFVMAATTSLSS